MKFTSGALFLLLAAPTSDAFVPKSFGGAKGVRASGVPSFLSSTTLKEEDMGIASSPMEQNGIEVAPHALAAKLSKADQEMVKVASVETRSAAAAYLSQYNGESGAALIYTKLVENGVTMVNGFSGGAVLPLLDQFHESHPRHAGVEKPPIRWITNSNESSAGHIAEGYAKSMPTNGQHMAVGVAIATSGPGVTNLITPLQDAICDGVPMVVLCGQAATVAPKDAFQQAPAVDLTRPCTKWSYQIKSAAEIPMVMDYAFYVARNGRPGPVFVDLPKDLLGQILTPELVDSFVDQNLQGPNDPSSFIKLVTRRRETGVLFQALQLGYSDKGLAFEVAKQKDAFKLQPVSAATSPDSYHMDHHPSNLIYKTGTVVDEETGLASDEMGGLGIDEEMTITLAELIRGAKKPVIIAGQGCNDSPEELKAFAEHLQIPVATTLHALGCFDERHELALNMLGMHGHPTPNFMVQEADLVLSIGSRFDDRITGRQSDFIPEARKAAEEGRGGVIHVDIRVTEKAKQVAPTYFVHSTGKEFLQTMTQALSKMERKPQTSGWIQRMKQLQQDFPVKVPHFRTEEIEVENAEGQMIKIGRTRLSAQSVVTEMNRQILAAGTMDETIFTTGVGVHQMVAAQLITWTQPRQMLSSGSLGTMGVALGYSIGAQLANGKKMIIAVDGDGSFNMTFTELKTVAEEGIPVKIMILDNDGQMMVEYWQRLFHANRLLAVRNSRNPDYSTLAQAFGIKAIYCDNEEEIEEKMNEFLYSDPGQPVVFHVRVERTPCLPLVAPGQPLDDMILEDVEVDVDGAAAPS